MPWQYAANGKTKSAERTVKINSLIRILFLSYQLFFWLPCSRGIGVEQLWYVCERVVGRLELYANALLGERSFCLKKLNLFSM